MLIAVGSLAIMGLALGGLLGTAARYLAVAENPIEGELKDMLPGSQCGQCGYVGCAQAAAALARGEAPVTLCPPGGRALAEALAAKLGVKADLSAVADNGPQLAIVAEEICIGCCRCIKACPTDAIVGAAKQIHNVIREACTGCAACIDRCPTEAMSLVPVPVSLQHWIWPKPELARGRLRTTRMGFFDRILQGTALGRASGRPQASGGRRALACAACRPHACTCP
jgi:electron transport complex protein RnfB